MFDMFDSRDVPKVTAHARFDFSLQKSPEHMNNLVRQRNKTSDEAKALIDRFQSETESMPGLIPSILQVFRKEGSYDIKSIVTLGRVLQRLGEKYLTQLEELNRQLDVLEFISKNPDFIAMVYGDFSTNVDQFLETFQTDPNPATPSE